MSEPDALVARITITPENLERWFDSQIPPLETWAQDWEEWLFATFDKKIPWTEMYMRGGRYPEIKASIRELVDFLIHRNGWLSAIWGQIDHCKDTNVWKLLSIEVAEDWGHMVTLLAAFRAVEAFSEGDKDDYVAFSNYFYSPESEYSSAAVRFSDGKSVMLKEPKLPASFLQDIRDQFHKAEKDRIITALQPDAWDD